MFWAFIIPDHLSSPFHLHSIIMKYEAVDWKSNQLNFCHRNQGSILRIRIQRVLEETDLWRDSFNTPSAPRNRVLELLQSKQASLFARPLPMIYRQGKWDSQTCAAVLQFACDACRAIRRKAKRREPKH